MWRYLIIIVVFVYSCNNEINEPVRLMGEAQGTYYSIIYYDDLHRDLQFEIDSLLSEFDKSVSLWVPNSVLSKVNNNDTNVVLDSYFINNFRLSQKVSEETLGAFDFTIGTLVKAWGFGYDNFKSVDSSKIDSLLTLTGYNKVKIKNNKVIKENNNITFDFNAIAQGYSVDMISDYLTSKNINNFLIDIGGEVIAKGHKHDSSNWRVGIEKPANDVNDDRDLSGVIKLENASIATSGNYRKFFIENGIKYSHIIDSRTGYPAQHNLLSVSVVCNNTALADAYATACMTMGLDESIKFIESREDLEAIFIYSDENGNYKDYSTLGFKELIVSQFN